jgi:hypothetical protein
MRRLKKGRVMKREELLNHEIKIILDMLYRMDSIERQWILDVQIPQYICYECWEPTTDCNCEKTGDI